MNNFEVTLLISPDTNKNDHSKILEYFKKLVTSNDGSIIGKEDWGLRELTYKINNSKKAFYFFYQINIAGNTIQTLKKNNSQNQKIILNLFIKVDTHDKLPTKMLEGND